MALLRATRSHALLILIGIVIAAMPFGPNAAAYQIVPDAEGIVLGRDGDFQLSPEAGAAPAGFGTWEQFGILDATRSRFDQAFDRVRVYYREHAPVGTESYVAVRASSDGKRWSEWNWDVQSGVPVALNGASTWIQHRIVMLGNDGRTPSVGHVQVVPEPRAIQSSSIQAQGAVAPTYRLRVTRQGMVGGRTANGHRITPNDMFVSLPSWKSLSSKNGREYMVRLSANGKSVVVPVMDVGPWNRNDNFWDAKRATYKDLPRGWPEDHAAFYEGYNRGRAEKGIVRYPTAVDVADGAYWALGLKGAQATVDVTFLWLGQDPGANPAPLNPDPSKRPKDPSAP
jgi:hypothetical protein